MNSTPNSSAACWCAVPARPRRRHALVLSKFPKKSKGSPTKGLYGRGQQLLVEMGPPSFVAITHLPLSKFPRYSQCRLSFVCIMPHQCDPAYSRHHSPLLALPSAPESGRANPNHALQLNPEHIIYNAHAHRAGVPPPHVRPLDGLAPPGPYRPRQHQIKPCASAPTYEHPRPHRRSRILRAFVPLRSARLLLASLKKDEDKRSGSPSADPPQGMMCAPT